MNPSPLLQPVFAGLLVGSALVAGCATPTAKVARVEAETLALAQVPGGTVKEAELEKEPGRLVWAFDLATPGTPNLTEIQVDALTGAIVSPEIETPAQPKKESAADRK